MTTNTTKKMMRNTNYVLRMKTLRYIGLVLFLIAAAYYFDDMVTVITVFLEVLLGL